MLIVFFYIIFYFSPFICIRNC